MDSGVKMLVRLALVFVLVAWVTGINADPAANSLRIFTWEGYVTEDDISNVNTLLEQNGYDIEVSVVSPYADDADQMFDVIRSGGVDVSFLTLFFIKM